MSSLDAFRGILAKTEFTLAEQQANEKHFRAVRRRLESSFQVSQILPFGSYERGTSIRHSSDLDLLLVLRRVEINWGGMPVGSDTALKAVRQTLCERFSYTDIGRDGPAIALTFSDGRRFEVVPGYWRTAGDNGWPIFAIPDGYGGWMDTSPKLHGSYIAKADRRSGGKLKQVARIFKYWRLSRTPSVPINSFYVEMLMAVTGMCAVGSTYAECFERLLATLCSTECANLDDPLGISSCITACDSAAKLERALQSATAALCRVSSAVHAESAGDWNEAYRLWSIAFNGEFPRSARRASAHR